MVSYTDPKQVTEIMVTDLPRKGQTVSGYGGSVPTRFMIKYGPFWHRVYMMQYGNSGSAYIRKNNEPLFIDIDTEYRIVATAEGKNNAQ